MDRAGLILSLLLSTGVVLSGSAQTSSGAEVMFSVAPESPELRVRALAMAGESVLDAPPEATDWPDGSGGETPEVTPEHPSPTPAFVPATRSLGREGGGSRVAQAAPAQPPRAGCALNEPEARFEEVLELLLKQHVDSGLTREALYHAAIEGMLNRASPESQGRGALQKEKRGSSKREPLPSSNRLLEPGERKNLERLREGTFLGVGLWLDPQPERGFLEVRRVMRGSPAAQAGLRSGDRILRVDQQPVGAPKAPESSGARPMLASVSVREQSGSTVVFTVLRGRELVEVQLVRKEFPLEAVSAQLLPDGIGLIQLEYLSAKAPAQARQVLSQVQARGAVSLILDLRASFGDDPQVGRQLLELFVPAKTPVLMLEHRAGSRVALHSLAPPLSTLPLVVLVDEQTVGVAEALAATLREVRQAKVIGGRTSGRASLETLVGLKDGHGVLISTATMRTPGGLSWDGTGLIPDIPVPVPAELDPAQLREASLAERLARDGVLRVAIGMLER